jgi:hypothetical protein
MGKTFVGRATPMTARQIAETLIADKEHHRPRAS